MSDNWEERREQIIGLGERSLKKSYYPELKQRLDDLERFRALLNQSNDAVFFAQISNGRFIDANKTASQLLGYTQEEILALSIHDITPKNLVIEIDKLSTDELPDFDKPPIITTELTTKNGRSLPVEISFRKVTFQNEKYAVIVARNISERRKAEQALRESENRFRWLAENTSDGLLILEKDKLLFINQPACTILGYTFEQIQQMTAFDFAAPQEKFVINQIIELGMKTHKVPAEMEFWIQQQDGTQRFVNFRLAWHQISSETARIYIAMTDITARKEREADLEKRVRERTSELAEANQQLKELDKLKSIFVSNVSHELRTPITNIQLYLGLLEQTQDDEKADRFMQILTTESKRLGNLIEDLLTLSRLESEAGYFPKEPYILDAIIAQVIINYDAKAAAANIHIQHEPNPQVPPVPLMKERMIQVFTNLLSNALAYTPANSTVSISSELSEGDNGRFVTITIHNEGPPIPEKDIPHIFDRFYRGQNALNSDKHGTGLGLAISKQIVEYHQGAITVESTEKSGTSFFIRLPV
ncbi:MAG: PAS domain S-box protein [Anaerolineae bacterium]|nr:PAS domain S-box protein [Anaerolineae bacterium]